MTAMFELLILAAFSVGIICCDNADRQISECRIPDNSSIDGSLSVHINLSKDEFDLLQIEGQCFLFCATRDEYSTEIGMRNYSLSRYWPFISVNQIEMESICRTIFEVHECTRGCLRRHMYRGKYDRYECSKICKDTCHSATVLQNCELFECHPWIPLRGCQEMCIPSSHPHHPCNLGCETDNLQQSNSSAPPRNPVGPPLLIQDNKTVGQFKFNIDLSGAAPQPQKCESICNFTDLPPVPPVAFLFKFVDINSGNISYKWTANPFEHLDLTDYTCQELLVSFAVSNMEGLSMFSPEISLIINGDERLIPIPPNNLIISEKIDEREGFFGHVILNISWDAPQNYSYLDHFMIIINTTAGFNTILCGCTTWIWRVLPNESFVSIEAESVESLPLVSCSYDIQIYSIGWFGSSYPTRNTYAINTTFDVQSAISFECQRLWQNEGISFNLTWVLSPYYVHGLTSVISSFVVDFKLKDEMNNITCLIDNTTITFPKDGEIIIMNISNIDHNLNNTFLKTLLVEKSWNFYLESSVTWNISGPYVPPKHINTCVESSFNQVPDIDECFEGTHNCSKYANCKDSYGGYSCECRTGFTGDGQNCTNIDECSEGTHNCSKYANCKDSYGGYSCECRTGFTGDGQNCTISREVIIGTSVTAGLLLGGFFLVLITTGSVKIGRRLRTFVQQKAKQRRENVHHEMNVVHGNVAEENEDLDSSTAPGRYMVVRGSIKSKLPPTLIIKSTNLRVLDPIGQGEFGIVYKGYLAGQYTDEIVAIKTLKGFIDDGAVRELLSECVKMKNFDNLHVMSLKGVCLDGGPVPYIILPYMANGSLASYLRKQRKNLVVMKETTSTTSNIESDPQSQVLFVRKRLMDMCLQVAKGMEYLASEKVVHRDLAARNCMIDINMVIKVADFGLSVNIGAKEYYRLAKHVHVKLPVKWMAPESLADYMFSEKSDVWSYGVTCWEIFTGCQAPYASVKSSALLSYLQQGERLAMPNNSACNDDLYFMMQWCLEMEPDERPSFSILVNTLSKSLENQAGYLHVGAFTDNPDSSIDQNSASSDQEL